MESRESMCRRIGITAFVVLLWAAWFSAAEPASLIVVESGVGRMPIVVAADAPAATREAADELAEVIATMSGARLEVLAALPDPLPESAIWIGPQPVLADLFPDADLTLNAPEEILLSANARHLAILGRDAMRDGRQVKFGTANAVYTFLQDFLDVRWLWPGELGEDVPRRETIALEPFTHRFSPQFQERVFRYPRSGSLVDGVGEVNRWWNLRQRGRGSFRRPDGYVSTGWWARYGDTHPEYFGMQPDGQRRPVRGEVKLCVSNPNVAARWLEEAEQRFRADPDKTAISVTPSDGGGWCYCEACQAWDHPEAGTLSRGRPVLTERYVRFWNLLARELQARLPDRPVYVSTFAYTRYQNPPVAATLAPNLIMGYVGHFPHNSDADRQHQKQQWQRWAALATRMRYRPNLFWTSGGFWGWPSVEMERTIEDFRFLAENHCMGIDVDSVFNHFATQGPQLYLMAQLAYAPLQDGEALLADYFRRGFGPGADAIREYFTLLEQTHRRVINREGWVASLRQAGSFVLEALEEYYTPEWQQTAQALLDRARAKTTDVPGPFAERVAFVQSGLDYTVLCLELIPLMRRVRTSGGADAEAVRLALARSRKRDAVMQDAPPFALDHLRIAHQVARRGLHSRLGPPTEAQLEVAARDTADRLAPAAWELVFNDDFQRETLGDAWEPIRGAWSVQDGELVLSAGPGLLLPAKGFPGLQRIAFEAVMPPPEGMAADDPEALNQISDLSVILHADASGAHRSGYFLQFGAQYNRVNRLGRLGVSILSSTEPRIQPGRRVSIEAAFDGQHVSLTVDGETVLRYAEPAPLVGADHQHLGLYFWTPARLSNLRIYTSEVRPFDPFRDDPDFF